MKLKQLQALQSELVTSRRQKVQQYHYVWDPILEEYGMNGFSDLLGYIREYKVVTEETALGTQGRVGSLNVLCRKVQSLMGLRNPEFLVENENPLDEPIAAVLEAAFKNVMNATEWPAESDDIVMDAVLYGTGISKVGYGSEFVYDESAWSAPVPQKAKRLLGEDEQHLPYGMTTEYTNFRVKEGMPMMQHVSCRDLYLNLGVRHRRDIRRIYQIHRRPVTDVLHDARYDDRAKTQITVTSARTAEDRFLYLDVYEQETQYVEVIECYDLATRQFCVFTEHAMRPLRDWTPFPFPIEKPYHFFSPIPMDGTVWGIPYALLILGQAKAINRCRAAVIDAIQRDGKTIIFADAAKFSVEQQLVVQNARDREWCFMDHYDPVNPPFYAYTFPSVNPDVMQLANLLQQDQNWVSGLTDQTRNSNASQDESATAANLRAEQQNLMVDEFLKRYERFQEQVGGDLAKIMLSRWDPEKLVKVVGPNENIFFWTRLNVERVIGSFTLRIVAGSTQKRDRAVQRKQWQELLPRIAEIYQYIMAEQQQQAQGLMGASPIDWHQVLRETFDLYDPTLARRILRPQNTVNLLMRLMSQHQTLPAGVSPELAQQVQAVANQRIGGGYGPASGQEGIGLGGLGGGGLPAVPGGPVPFEVRAGVPSAQPVQGQGGQILSETGGMAGRLN